MSEDSCYVHGTDPEEQRRLARLNGLINTSSLREIDLAGGERLLDVGSGLGQLTRGLARAVGPDGHVVAVERSDTQIAGARARAAADGEEDLYEQRQGRADALPLADDEWGTFDVAHTRFLLEHLPDPLEAVRQMVKAVRPGGRVVLEDDDHDLLRLWPALPEVSALWQAYIDTYPRLGNDPFIGRRLVALLHDAGAEPVHNTAIFFGSCAGQPIFIDMVRNFAGVMDGARELILDDAAWSPGRYDAARANLDAWAERPDAALWYTRCWAEGRRPLG